VAGTSRLGARLLMVYALAVDVVPASPCNGIISLRRAGFRRWWRFPLAVLFKEGFATVRGISVDTFLPGVGKKK